MKLIFLAVIASLNVSSDFVSKVLNNFDEKSFFVSISIKLESNDFPQKIVIENDDLYRYLSKQQQLNTKKYTSLISKKLIRNKELKLKSLNSDFKEVFEFEDINENAKKGKDHFVKTYFTESGVIKDGIELRKRPAIIQKLFEFEMLCLIDDETGYLYISNR
ncbi:hypothetical protein D3C71_644260 [compost metagenome]